MFAVMLKRILNLLRGLLSLRRGFAFGDNDLPAQE